MRLVIAVVTLVVFGGHVAASEPDPGLPLVPTSADGICAWLDLVVPLDTRDAIAALPDIGHVLLFIHDERWRQATSPLYAVESSLDPLFDDLSARDVFPGDDLHMHLVVWYWFHVRGACPAIPPRRDAPTGPVTSWRWPRDAETGSARFVNGTVLDAHTVASSDPVHRRVRIRTDHGDGLVFDTWGTALAYVHPAWPAGQALIRITRDDACRWLLVLPDRTWRELPVPPDCRPSLDALEPRVLHFSECDAQADWRGIRSIVWRLDETPPLIIGDWDPSRYL